MNNKTIEEWYESVEDAIGAYDHNTGALINRIVAMLKQAYEAGQVDEAGALLKIAEAGGFVPQMGFGSASGGIANGAVEQYAKNRLSALKAKTDI